VGADNSLAAGIGLPGAENLPQLAEHAVEIGGLLL